MGILSAIITGLKVLLEALGLWKFLAGEKAEADANIIGREQAASDAALEANKQRAQEESHREEVHKRSDADLDKSLDSLMRD